jgi:hypothetical protein
MTWVSSRREESNNLAHSNHRDLAGQCFDVNLPSLSVPTGTVEFKGFSVDDAAILGKKWALKSGEVYDQTYGGRFFRVDAAEILSRIAKERQSQGKPFPNLSTEEKPNRQTFIVNLTIELKD